MLERSLPAGAECALSVSKFCCTEGVVHNCQGLITGLTFHVFELMITHACRNHNACILVRTTNDLESDVASFTQELLSAGSIRICDLLFLKQTAQVRRAQKQKCGDKNDNVDKCTNLPFFWQYTFSGFGQGVAPLS